MERVAVINVCGLDWAFIERLEKPSRFAGLSQLAYRSNMTPPYPPDPVLASAMHATGLGPGEHALFQAACLNSNISGSGQFVDKGKNDLMKYHVARFFAKNNVPCLWYRGLYSGTPISSNEVVMKSLGLSAPINSEAPILDPLVEPSALFEIAVTEDACEVVGLGKIEGLKVEQVDNGKRLKVSYFGENMLVERGGMTRKLPFAIGDKNFRFRVVFSLEGPKPLLLVCDHNPTATNSAVSNPEELAWIVEEHIGGPLNFGRWAEFEAARLGLVDSTHFIAEISSHLNRSLQFALSAIEDGNYKFIYVWEESFELVRRIAASFLDFDHPRFNPEKASICEKMLLDMLLALDSSIEKILKLAEKKDWLVMLVSDYSLAPYRIGFDLNRWLVSENFAAGEVGPNKNWGFDWKNTRAFSVGPLIYVNLYGSMPNGIVMAGSEEERLIKEISERLKKLECPITHERAVRKVRRIRRTYSGRHLLEGPALVIGLFGGYRISAGDEIFSINSTFEGAGRLGLDPEVVQGFVMSNCKIFSESRAVDIFATVVKSLGFELPRRVEGRCLLNIS